MYRVMIVDDERVSQEYLRSLIPWEEQGFQLLAPIYSAEEAKKRLAAEKVDIVIFDISMPGENGVSLSTFIAQEYPAVLMLAVSSHDDYDYVRQVLKNGAHDYILKHRLGKKNLMDTLEAMIISKTSLGNTVAGKNEEEKIYDWIFLSGKYPFTTKGSCAATVSRVPQLQQVSEKTRSNVVSGILSLLKKEGQGIVTLFPIYYAPDLFISFYRFSDTISQHKMLGDMFLCAQNAKESILHIYKMDYENNSYPILCDYNSMPAHIVNATGMLAAKKESSVEKPVQVTLSLHNKRRLIAAMEEKNTAEASYLVEVAFAEIAPDDYSARLSVTNEFLDMLRSAAMEHNQKLKVDKSEELRFAQNQTIAEIVSRIQTLVEETLAEPGGNSQPRSPYIKQALEMIDTHYANDFSQDEAATRLGLSPAYFSKLFKQETGINFTETLNRRRIDAAKLLLNSGNNIKSTALQCGFKRYNYFITVFKHYVGITPSEYIKQK